LVRLVGPLKAKELIFTGQIIGGKEAQKIGLITRCLTDENLSKEVDSAAQKLAEGPTAAYGMAKKIINLGIDLHRTVVMEMEAFANGVAADTEDMKEGVNAFLEKRSAKFKGR
jgi:2-(1,2-epoxy-1,2-dihydrophenyl)acetyl-CoA isomerase